MTTRRSFNDPVTTRRAFLGTLTGGVFTAPLGVQAQQQGKVVRIGLLDYGASSPSSDARWNALRERLRARWRWDSSQAWRGRVATSRE